MYISFDPSHPSGKPFLLQIGNKQFRFSSEGLNRLQAELDGAYVDMDYYMTHTLGVTAQTFTHLGKDRK